MMHMTFYWSTKVTLLFDPWKTESWASYSLTLLACIIFSVFYQYMEDRRVRFKALASAAARTSSSPNEIPFLQTKLAGSGGRWSALRFAGGVLFGFNSAIGYLLMLAVMSFNGGVFLAVVGGLAFGYLLFRSGDEETTTVVVDNPCACA